MPAGYSKTPLAKKLGIKEGNTIRIINAPDYYAALFSDFPEKVTITTDKKGKKDCIHFFAKRAKDLQENILRLRGEIFPDGMIWVSWPKKASKVETDITEDVIRALALDNGLVDIKVCAVDEIWSGLKLVIPLKGR
ncbi:DUF3052 domain-containing protein [Terrimonas sp.]|uniref:DUF3052 family protein n=1 Tax=Terrimonas sp. TaxID=1914338 RepID=UPI000D508E12|nr:DUF3052 family protein [Terrimonas sp.]PVD51178.1 DUF3052 domain-containing protein [Terrimonas sp.]